MKYFRVNCSPENDMVTVSGKHGAVVEFPFSQLDAHKDNLRALFDSEEGYFNSSGDSFCIRNHAGDFDKTFDSFRLYLHQKKYSEVMRSFFERNFYRCPSSFAVSFEDGNFVRYFLSNCCTGHRQTEGYAFYSYDKQKDETTREHFEGFLINSLTNCTFMLSFVETLRSAGFEHFGDFLVSLSEGVGVHERDVVQLVKEPFSEIDEFSFKGRPAFLKVADLNALCSAVYFTGDYDKLPKPQSCEVVLGDFLKAHAEQSRVAGGSMPSGAPVKNTGVAEERESEERESEDDYELPL